MGKKRIGMVTDHNQEARVGAAKKAARWSGHHVSRLE